MRTSLLLKLTASALALSPIAVALAADTPALKFAAKAEKALEKGKLDQAIAHAEAAVAAAPQQARYRMLLGRSYLEAGRYGSAATSFADALALDAGTKGAALSLALARIGLGEQDAARSVIDAHGAQIPTGDRGLALALAGDPVSGVALLEAEVRNGGADAKTRQNLALSYALAGRWPEAKLMASYDLDPATVSQRVMEWSRFAREQQASAQVAALLGVIPQVDPGQPARLALNMPQPQVKLAEVAPPPPVAMTVAEPVQMADAPLPVLVQAPSAIEFAPRSEIVQAIARPATAALGPDARRAPQLEFERPTGGRFVVQLGAYDSAEVAGAAWERMSQRIVPLRTVTPASATFVRGGTMFHRLSVSGFPARTVAVRFCEQLRARGGQCFVREAAGDAPLQWVRRNGTTRLAAR